jgi:hypothetical protein
MKNLLFILSIIIFTNINLFSAQLEKGNIVFFTHNSRNIQSNALLNETLKTVKDTFNNLKRFHPIENIRIFEAIKEANILHADNKDNLFQAAAKILDTDIYATIDITRRGKIIYATLNIIPLNKNYSKLRKKILIKSRIPINIPYRLSKEITYLHKKLPLYIEVEEKLPDNLFIINAGQWHGLKTGKYYTDKNLPIIIKQTFRYKSIASLDKDINLNQIKINIYPETRKMIDELDKIIYNNIEYKYGLKYSLLKGNNPEKKFIEGICIINPGANFCLPGYGSFLSTNYLGFSGKSNLTGVSISLATIFTQLFTTPYLTKFNTNFFPGLNDREKDKKIKHLQYFLWGALPLTFTVSYLDQLRYQYESSRHLPPFFLYKDSTALTLSLLFPGGGLFYKGYSFIGWSYYLSELGLMSYGIFNLNDHKKSKYTFSIVGIIKIIELANAYFIKPSFKFYNFEIEEAANKPEFKISFENYLDIDNILMLSASIHF